MERKLSILYSKLSAIGLLVSSKRIKKEFNDIEEVLLDALYEVDNDSRMLSLIFSWANIHGDYIIADKFFKAHKKRVKRNGECPWVYALCAYLVHSKNHKFKNGLIKQKKEIWVGDRVSESSRKLQGTIDYLEALNIIVPKKFLRIRESDCLSREVLIKQNTQYRYRFIYGVNWRSEIIYAIHRGLDNPNKISKELGLSYSNVWSVFNDFKLVERFVIKNKI
ncbi:MAG: hypothetical protein ACPGJV_13445 [Bacteriovoracaceae bacterium]